MIRRHVLAALATGVEAGDDDAARAAVRRADWVLRGPAKRRLERALIDAALITSQLASAADPDAMRHVQCAAALAVAGRDDLDLTDRARVIAAYRELPAVRPPGAPVATIAALAIAVALAGMFVWLLVALRHPHHARPSVPAVTGAYLTGGAPQREPALAALLTGPLIDLVIESDTIRHGAGSDTDRKHHAAALRTNALIAAHGEALVADWGAMLDALDRWVDAPSAPRGFHAAELDLRLRVHAVSDRFAALGLGYYLAADVLVERRGSHAALLVYTVEEVAFVHAGFERRRVLGLRRLDRLNVRKTLLGMQGEELGDPVVLLDNIDEFIDARIQPLASGEPYHLGDDAWRMSADGAGLGIAARDAIDRELVNRTKDEVRHWVTASVRRHEARHGVDADRDTPLRTPAVLAFLGDDRAPFVLRTRAELAAYTSQIANDPVTPQLALWNVASQAFNHDRWGSAETYVGVFVIEGIARELGIVPSGPILDRGQLDRGRLAEIALPLASQSDQALRDAARRLWTEMYAEPMLPIQE